MMSMPELFIYILFALGLLLAEAFYFSIAEKCKIMDQPNDRSSHQAATIRGGGIIFPFAIIIAAVFFNDFPYALIGALFLIAFVSFSDDIKSVPSHIRFLVHSISVGLIFTTLGVLRIWPLWAIILAFILIIGVINAFNFMDGINGITGIYSLVILFTLFYINQNLHFINNPFIIIPSLGCLIFLFFNFRKKAKCFAGDVGSVSMGFWICTLLLMLMIQTDNLKYILLLSVYGMDTILTILHRLALKQNIFKAHRLHFYQYMVNECKLPHLKVAVLYGVIQAVTNIFILATDYNFVITFLIVAVILSLVYVLLKFRLLPHIPINKYVL